MHRDEWMVGSFITDNMKGPSVRRRNMNALIMDFHGSLTESRGKAIKTNKGCPFPPSSTSYSTRCTSVGMMGLIPRDMKIISKDCDSVGRKLKDLGDQVVFSSYKKKKLVVWSRK